MSKKVKYVIVNNSYPILFSDAQNHSDFNHFKLTSAGFCYIDQKDCRFEVSCFGKSTSLNLEANENDKIKIELLLNEY